MSKKILIIESHPDNGRFLAEHFSTLGCEAVWTQSAEEAINYCSNWKPSAIILDLRAQGPAGQSLLEAIKSNPLSGDIPVICTAASVKQQQIDWAKTIGAVAFIAKPYDNSMLSNLVNSLNGVPTVKAVGQAA